MKKTAFVLLILLFTLPSFSQDNVWFNGSFDDALNEAQQNGKQVLVYFYSDG